MSYPYTFASQAGPVFEEIDGERSRQNRQWGEQNHTLDKWLLILMEEVGEAAQAILKEQPAEARAEMIQVASVAVAIVEAMGRYRARGWDWRQGAPAE